MHNFDSGLFGGSVASAMCGLFAEVSGAPPQVTWAFVVLSGIGGMTVAARIVGAVALKWLDVELSRFEVAKHRGENQALKAELETLRSVRFSQSQN